MTDPSTGTPAEPNHGQGAAPQYGATPAPQYGGPAPQYGANPAPQYGAPQYGSPQQGGGGFGGNNPPTAGWWPEPGTGKVRFFDHRGWGPYKPENTTIAIFAHLSHMLGGIILSVVLFFVGKDKDEFTRHHTTEVLNRDLVMLLLGLPGLILYVIGYVQMITASMNNTSSYDSTTSTAAAEPPVAAIIMVLIGALLMMLPGIYSLVLTIMGVIAAAKGRYIRLALPFRFVKGALTKEECAQRNAELDQAQAYVGR